MCHKPTGSILFSLSYICLLRHEERQALIVYWSTSSDQGSHVAQQHRGFFVRDWSAPLPEIQILYHHHRWPIIIIIIILIISIIIIIFSISTSCTSSSSPSLSSSSSPSSSSSTSSLSLSLLLLLLLLFYFFYNKIICWNRFW